MVFHPWGIEVESAFGLVLRLRSSVAVLVLVPLSLWLRIVLVFPPVRVSEPASAAVAVPSVETVGSWSSLVMVPSWLLLLMSSLVIAW